MALDAYQINGCYVSSSLPKALYVPSPSVRFRNRDSVNTLYLKPKRKTAENITPESHTSKKECSPVAGRQNLSVQTDLYLEELCDFIEEADAETETDPVLDRPPSPLFVPASSGIDVGTQIYSGELFDFDEEVEPILEALVGQTLEQALIELMAEEELAVIADLQMGFETKRNSELAELKRLEEQEKRLLEEKKRRLKEQEEAIKLEDEVAQKIVACLFSQNYLSELVPQVYKKLEAEGYFEADDPELNEVEENFWPWLLNEVDSEIATLEASCHLLDTLIQDSVQQLNETSVIHPVSSNVHSDSLINPDEEVQKLNGLLKETEVEILDQDSEVQDVDKLPKESEEIETLDQDNEVQEVDKLPKESEEIETLDQDNEVLI